MKNFVKTLVIFISAAVLIMAFAGCKDSSSDGGGDKPSNIVVKDGGEAVDSLTLELNDTKTLTVSADDATDYYWDIIGQGSTDIVELTNDQTATVSIKGKNIGSAKIVAYAGNSKGDAISKEINITVIPIGPSLTLMVNLNGNELTSTLGLKVNEQKTLTTVVTANSTVVNDAIITWLSNDNAVATVSNGVIKGINEGNTSITVSATKSGYHSASKTINIEVSENGIETLVLTIKDEKDQTVNNNTTVTLKLFGGLDTTTNYAFTASATNVTADIEWESDDTDIADVDNDGNITIKKRGNAKITVTATVDDLIDTKSFTIINKHIAFEWDYETDGGFIGTQDITSANRNNQTTYITGRGVMDNGKMPVVIKNWGNSSTGQITAKVSNDNTNKGIVLDGTGLDPNVAPPAIFVIGTKDGNNTANASCPEGLFDFSAKEIQVTFTGTFLETAYKINITDPTASGDMSNRSFQVRINHNTTTAADSLLTDAGSRIFAWQYNAGNVGNNGGGQRPAMNNPTTSTTNGYWNYAPGGDGKEGTGVSIKFPNTSTTTTGSAGTSLEKAFVSFIVFGSDGTSVSNPSPATMYGCKFLLKSVSIEYLY
jgi:hypothetical protein